tara:strand:+ start:34 stop:1608 length:1575 start_codon:yes stop_codon:yes gene_type:complete
MINYFNKRIFILLVFPIILGGLSVLSFQPFNLFFINFFSLPSLFWLILYVKKKSKSIYRKKPFTKNLFLLGTSFGFGFFFFGLYWIIYSMTFDEAFRIFIPFGLILIPIFLSLFFSIPITLAGYLIDEKISSIFLISFFFGLSDFGRSVILTGFPWNLWIYSLSYNVESLQFINILGFFSYNLIFITIFFFPAILFFKNSKKYFILGSLLTLALSNYFYGSYKINSSEKNLYNNLDKKINFKIVTAGLSLFEFSDPLNVSSRLIRLSEPQKEKKTIFVWPEGTFMSENFSVIKNNKEIVSLFKKNFSNNHLIILGVNTIKKNNQKDRYFNSMIIVDNNLNIIAQYDKKKLVPFGEFLPLEKLMNKLGMKKITPGYTSFSTGKRNSLLQFQFNTNEIKILPLICYEIIFPNLIEGGDSKYNFIVNISEDAWFGESIGPYQHFSKAIFRSIESRRFVVRSANKGKSVFIDPNGKVIKALKPSEAGNIELEIPLIEPTNSQYKKSLIFFSLLITYIFTFFVLRKFKI